MANTAVDYKYAYPFASHLVAVDSARSLQLATSGGAQENPYFFKGRFVQPRVAAELLLAVSQCSRTRFYSPTELRERLLAAADPVVTSGGDNLRFEAFSVCCGVYARADFKCDSIDGDWVGRGTTNVDFNAPMRTALAGILESEKIGLNVGADVVELEHSGGTAVEKKVKLPVRWLKGFVEVQAYQARMKQRLEVAGSELRQFLATLPRQETWNKGTLSYVVPSGKGLRLSQRQTADAIPLGAPGRLRILESMARRAKILRVYCGDDDVSAWELVADGASLHIVISPDAARGFSGEGQALSKLATRMDDSVLAKVRAQLQWQACVDPTALQGALEGQSAESALSMLGARGLVGFDVAEGKYFHRELPFDMSLVEELQPRLLAAHELLAENKVKIDKKDANGAEAYVQGTDAQHRVKYIDEEGSCTCRWFSKYQGSRGPCKHILAVQLACEK